MRKGGKKKKEEKKRKRKKMIDDKWRRVEEMRIKEERRAEKEWK